MWLKFKNLSGEACFFSRFMPGTFLYKYRFINKDLSFSPATLYFDKSRKRLYLRHLLLILEQEPGGVNLAEKVTNFDMVSNDLHI